ncbi:putative SAM-dependent methyltransferase Bucepa02006346 [Paramagnetospirillum magnetotacticum MS-1]|uniref:Putative SAM-dependent methyltransferase Bucepa02006346 n=1 Tax=Paramagnetospirillum magnetotacticum MS-1 TaxID=272627 RepID=A0A0C2UFH5_PARME|nr:class I SAM-dependent methyltransferase [Paramagnetospirillum magnetotacticum]KIM00268.1 putative SAM-dependent methyltransferase Bucepa02006346 [Paramagnetospirillum magnetotacticum MS-1]
MGTDPFRIAPSAWITRFAPLVPKGGTVLDLACGGGRHSRLFLDRGHKVTALDRDVAQAQLAEGAELIAADLEDGSAWPLAGRHFDAVVVTNYLWRPLFPAILGSLNPGGVLLYETFALGNEKFGRPANPDHLLKRGELLELTQGLTVVAYEDGAMGRAKVVQRICAVNGTDLAALT